MKRPIQHKLFKDLNVKSASAIRSKEEYKLLIRDMNGSECNSCLWSFQIQTNHYCKNKGEGKSYGSTSGPPPKLTLRYRDIIQTVLGSKVKLYVEGSLQQIFFQIDKPKQTCSCCNEIYLKVKGKFFVCTCRDKWDNAEVLEKEEKAEKEDKAEEEVLYRVSKIIPLQIV